MVNLGRPSRGCQTCKTRRIKCDLNRPACQRCVSSGRTCPGVPTEQDVLFRDQTQRTTSRSKGKPSAALSSSSAGERRATAPKAEDGALAADKEMVAVVRRPRATAQNYTFPPGFQLPGQSIEDFAIGYYFEHFVPGPNSGPASTHVTSALRDLFPSSSLTSPVHLSTTALSLVALTNFPNFKQFRPRADALYGQAIRALNAALRDPDQAKLDGTLMSVVLMGFYELMTKTENSIRNFQNHFKGATALALSRGTRQFEDPTSLKIFRSIRSNHVFDCVQDSRSIETSEYAAFWAGDGLKDEGNPPNGLPRYGIKLSTLRQRAHELFAPGVEATREEINALIADSRKLDAQLTEWFYGLPEHYSYYSVPHLVPVPDDVEAAPIWPGVVHVYRGKFVASVQDAYRSHRIYVQGIIGRCLSHLHADADKARGDVLLQATLFTTRKLVDDICAGVPYQLDYAPGVKSEAADFSGQKASEALGAYLIIRPLYLLLTVDCVPEVQRRWIRGRLVFIAEEYGLHQARFLSQARVSLMSGKQAFAREDAFIKYGDDSSDGRVTPVA